MTRSRWRRWVFSILVLLTLVLTAFFGGVVLRPDFFLSLVGAQTEGHISEHFRQPHHRIHDLTFALLLGTAVVGMLVQLRAPSKNVAGQLMALIPFAGLALAAAVTNLWVLSVPWVAVSVPTVLAMMFHPTGRHLFRSFSVARFDRVMLALVAVAAAPMLAFAWTNIGLQRAGPTDHALLGHYGYMAALSFTVLGVGLLSSARPDGWRLTAWVAGLLPASLGLASLVFPDVDGRLSLGWALAAVLWGFAFIAAAEFGRGASRT
ncbi:MAG TPA: hypothetical protein VGR87_01155 [Candidatus Limnocylindria bacterium]|jgi:hypothetical protein|nr:hypothetical protein [Candidatus Limnocylindria bacterium]